MKAQIACLPRVALLCLLLSVPAMARSIPYSVAFPDRTANEWSPSHSLLVAEPSRLARTPSGTGFDISFSGAWPSDPHLAVSSGVSTLLTGLVSDRMAGLVVPPNSVSSNPVPPNAVAPTPVPEPNGLLAMLVSGILGLGGMLGRKLMLTHRPNRD